MFAASVLKLVVKFMKFHLLKITSEMHFPVPSVFSVLPNRSLYLGINSDEEGKELKYFRWC